MIKNPKNIGHFVVRMAPNGEPPAGDQKKRPLIAQPK